MRIRFVMLTVALLALASSARAQTLGMQPPAVQPPMPPSQAGVPALGAIDFGARATGDVTGDEARFERYRDLRDGAYSVISLQKKTTEYLFDANAFNIGYRDQRYIVDYNGGRSRVLFNWLSLPINYGYNTSTPWVEVQPGVLSLSTATRLAVQNKVPGVIGVPQSPAQLQAGSTYALLAQANDIQAKRDGGNISLAYDATKEVAFIASFNTQKKSGSQPYGTSFAFTNANEVPLPLDNRTNDFQAGLEWTNPKGMLRFAWDGSWFDNHLTSLLWDNPLRATDTTPYDPSGYSNGNGPAQGRLALPPSNSLNTFGGTGLYKLPKHTTLNGTLSFTSMNQNDALIPWTTNAAIANPTVYQQFPGLATLPRTTAEAEVHGVNALVNLTSRPNRLFGLTARYRFNDHKNLTTPFDATEYVRFDAVPEETGSVTEQFNITENRFDVTATLNAAKYTSFRIGYGYDTFNRTGRSFSDMTDNILRASADVIGNQYMTIRGQYELNIRKGSGFSELSLEDGGLQPGLRFYDEADRDQNKGTILLVLTPIQTFDVTVSYSAIHDVYKGPGHEFGLLDNTNHAINVGINVNPANNVSFGFNYGRDSYSTDQASRNANPDCTLPQYSPCPPSGYNSWTDPNRTWTLANDERVNNFNLYLDLPNIVRNVTVKFSYDLSDSDNGFTFGGPRIVELTNNQALTPGDTPPCSAGVTSCFLPLPNVTNQWQRLTADVSYYFTRQVGLAVGYWYEKFDNSDFATVNEPNGTPRIDYLGEISTGYGNRPYKGNTALVRLLYHF